MNILVIIEHKDGKMHRMSREAIVGAQKIGGQIKALVIGKDHEEVVNELLNYEIEKTTVVDHDLIPAYNADGYKEIVKQVFDSIDPKFIVAGHTYQSRDFIPRISAALDIPMLADLIVVERDKYVKQVMNSKLNASITSNQDKAILTFQSASFSEEDIIKGSNSLEKFKVNLDPSLIKSKAENPFQETSSEVDLESADFIVSVGRGIEKEENKSIAFNLAQVLGAEVSASRPVVDAG